MLNTYEKINYYARNIIAVPSGTENNTALAMTAIKNLSDLGFTLDAKGTYLLSTASKQDITDWYHDTVKLLREKVGADKEYKPFYPNFPQEVMDKTNMEMHYDQLLHYWGAFISDVFETDADIIPDGKNEKDGIKSLEEHPLSVLRCTDKNKPQEAEKIAADIFKNLLHSKKVPTEGEMTNIICPYLREGNYLDKCNNVENRMLLDYIVWFSKKNGIPDNQLKSSLPSLTTNDYLRIMQLNEYHEKHSSITSGSKINLDDIINPKDTNGNIKQLNITTLKGIKSFVINGLSEIPQEMAEADMKKHSTQWKKILHNKMHIKSEQYNKDKYKSLQNIADKMYKNQPLWSFESLTENLYDMLRIQTRQSSEKDGFITYKAYQNFDELLDLLSTRPGIFVKSLNRLIDIEKDLSKDELCYEKFKPNEKLQKVASNVFKQTKTEDLINLISYLKSRTREDKVFAHNVKGRLFVDKNEKKHMAISQETADIYINLAKDSIKEQIKDGKNYGNIYIEPQISTIPCPSADRSGTEAMKSYPQGSHIPVEKTQDGKMKDMRILLWFGNNGRSKWGNIIDISCAMYKKDQDGKLQHYEDVAWYTGRKDNNDLIYFSGDWIGADSEVGATEFHDLHMEALKNAGVDYVMLYVCVYSGGMSFKEEDVYFGWQEREGLNESSQVDPRAVKQYEKLSGDARGIIPVIVDVNKSEVIVTNTLCHDASQHGDSLQRHRGKAEILLDMYDKGDRFTLKELTMLAVESGRGNIVDSPEKADTIISVTEYDTSELSQNVTNITSTDKDVWLGEFMTKQEVTEETVVKDIVTAQPQTSTNDKYVELLNNLISDNKAAFSDIELTDKQPSNDDNTPEDCTLDDEEEEEIEETNDIDDWDLT